MTKFSGSIIFSAKQGRNDQAIHGEAERILLEGFQAISAKLAASFENVSIQISFGTDAELLARFESRSIRNGKPDAWAQQASVMQDRKSMCKPFDWSDPA